MGFSSTYLRNSSIPNTNFQVQYRTSKIVSGLGIDYKTLQPSLETSKKIATTETISSITTSGYIKIITDDFTLMFQGTYGGNNTDLMMLGGYGVKTINDVTGIQTYSQIKNIASWVDISLGKSVQPGLFLGYTKNLGSSEELLGALYERVTNIDYVYRISPRIILNYDKLRIASELEITSAAYGNTDKFAKVTNSKEVTNLRLLIAVYYFF